MAPAGIGADVEGVHAVAAAAAAGRVRRLLVERGRQRDEPIARTLELVRSRGGEIEVVDDISDAAHTAVPQGVVAHCRPIETVSIERAAECGAPASLIVLDHVEDPRNVGAISRSAVAAGVGAMVVSWDRAAPLGASAFKAAAGALETLPVAVVRSVADAVRRLESLGVWTVGLEGTADRSLLGLDLLAEPVALVVGAEGRGLSRLVSERVSLRARLPLAGDVESLNVSVAASLAMFELARVRGWVA
ncbi:MAG: 23S rRNA (guanosine(2251)-2'-O)-methyltransferase RlmB [Acidimicrobiia bacterium]